MLQVIFTNFIAPNLSTFLSFSDLTTIFVRIHFYISIFCLILQYYLLLHQYFTFASPDFELLTFIREQMKVQLWGFLIISVVEFLWIVSKRAEITIDLRNFFFRVEVEIHSWWLWTISTPLENVLDIRVVENSRNDFERSIDLLVFCYYCTRNSLMLIKQHSSTKIKIYL